MAKCQQKAIFRYTWPGRNESFICLEHAKRLLDIAHAMSFYVQVIPLLGDEVLELSCSQEMRNERRDGDRE